MPKFVPPIKKPLVDQVAELDAQIRALEEKRDKIKLRLSKKLGVVIGDEFKANVYEKLNTWLDHGRVRRKLGAEAFAKCFKSSTSRQVRITKIKE